MVLALVVLLGFAGLVIDVGRVYVAQRQLQAAVDAAALAAGQDLPDSVAAHDERDLLRRDGLEQGAGHGRERAGRVVQVPADAGCRRRCVPDRLDEREQRLLHALVGV